MDSFQRHPLSDGKPAVERRELNLLFFKEHPHAGYSTPYLSSGT
jgi:hypothetical protein